MKQQITGLKWIALALMMALVMPVTAQISKVTLSGLVRDENSRKALSYVQVVLLKAQDSSLAAGTVTGDDGRFSIRDVQPGNYILSIGFMGYQKLQKPLLAGELSAYLDLGNIGLTENAKGLNELTVTARQDEVSGSMDKKTFSITDNVAQAGASVLDAMKNLPGVTVQDGKVQLRGSDKVMVLIDGKQTALTGFGSESGLDNLPASAIEKIEIINNPSARYDANGNAGIVNIIYKKEKQEGFNGKVGLTAGLGALWIKQPNYPGVGAQYQATPKINPSLSLNYRKRKINLFLQADDLYNQTLNKNEFADRYYDDGTIVRQQTRRNRNTNLATVRGGMDWTMDANNTLTVSGMFSSEKIIDHGEEPFFNASLSERQRLWQFIEDELKTTAMASVAWRHQFKQPGRTLSAGFNYTYHRENEQYFFTNYMPGYTGLDSFKLLSDEHVTDLNIDYVQPLRYGRIEGGVKFRRRYIPVNMHFIPGLNSPLDTTAGGWANYTETIPAVYGNYVLENRFLELEAGLRAEYVQVQYDVNPNHRTYASDGYHYVQSFPNLRVAYKINATNKLSFFYNRRVDRPNEVDIRIFPKYDDAEIIKVGNPALRPQFTNTYELGYKTSWSSGYVYASVYHKQMDATITRIASIVPGSTLIYNVFQNAGKSYNTGAEAMFSMHTGKWALWNLNLNIYRNRIDAFTVENLYPQRNVYSAAAQEMTSGNVKFNSLFHLPRQVDLQLTAIYLAPDIIPQGQVDARFSIDLGLRKTIQKGNAEIFVNATDIANTLRYSKTIQGDGFWYRSVDYYETQVIRAGYSRKF